MALESINNRAFYRLQSIKPCRSTRIDVLVGSERDDKIMRSRCVSDTKVSAFLRGEFPYMLDPRLRKDSILKHKPVQDNSHINIVSSLTAVPHYGDGESKVVVSERIFLWKFLLSMCNTCWPRASVVTMFCVRLCNRERLNSASASPDKGTSRG